MTVLRRYNTTCITEKGLNQIFSLTVPSLFNKNRKMKPNMKIYDIYLPKSNIIRFSL